MALIYNASFDSTTRVLSLLDKAGNVISSCEVPSKSNELTLTATEDNSSVRLMKNGKLSNTYEVDTGSGWTAYTFYLPINLNKGDSVKWRCKRHPTNQSRENYVQFEMTGTIEASGNCNSMLSSNFKNMTSLSGYDYAFNSLFYGCTALTKAPDLPATTLSSYCYYSMFNGCTALTKAPNLPATTLSSYCYYYMFYGCKSLTKAPNLPATTLSSYCYYSMFNGCTALTKAPDLPATTLSSYCYYFMFNGCTALTKAPDLPATTLSSYCYSYVFRNCTSLAEVSIAATTATASDALTDWLEGVPPTGDFYCNPNTYFKTGISGIPVGWNRFVLGAGDTGTTTTMYHNGSPGTVRIGTSSYGDCYSAQGWAGFRLLDEMHKDGYTFGAQTPLTMYHHDIPVSAYSCEATVEDGFTETMYDVGNGQGYLTMAQQNAKGYYLTSTPYTGLTLTATADNSSVKLTKHGTLSNTFEVDTGSGWTAYSFGKPINLNNGDSVKWRCEKHPSQQETLYYVQFEMTGTIEASGNCNSMLSSNFENMTSLSGYRYAFKNLFDGCKSLTKAPDLPATTLAGDCYTSMFYGCTALTRAPSLPSTTPVYYCYTYMFYGCTALTQAPYLPAMTLAEGCYRSMFKGCSALTEVRIAATKSALFSHESWLEGVPPTGDFYCDPNATLFPTGKYGTPVGWNHFVLGARDTGTTTTMYHNGSTETVRVGTSSYGTCYSAQGWSGFKLLDEMHKDGYTFGAQTPITMYYWEDAVLTYSVSANGDDSFTETMYDVGNGLGYVTLPQANNCGYYLVPTAFTGLTLTATADNSSVKLTKIGTLYNTFKVNTGNGWSDYTFDTVIDLNEGESCKWQCSAHPTMQNDTDHIKFVMTGTIEASGNCKSMLAFNFGSITTLPGHAFDSLFSGCTALTQAPELPDTSLNYGCYLNMFNGCTALTKAPELPATTVSSSCYQGMFQGCTSLTQAPYLPATSLDITSLCYSRMFYGCSSLAEVRIAATKSGNYSFDYWLKDVSATGDFYCNPNATIFPTDSADGIPKNWTRKPLSDYPNP